MQSSINMTESQTLKDKYSVIIPYRNRESHLEILLPRLFDVFKDKSYEIIVVEQDDNDKFQKNSLYNIAVGFANNDILIFHDVDYIPSTDVDYFTDEYTPLYPVRNALFLDKNLNIRNELDIPAGYRNFINDVGNHSGGVFVLHKKLFYNNNGLNPYYKGWGKEDDDTRERYKHGGREWKRNATGLFYVLYHEDNKPADTDIDFINNNILLSQLNLNIGYKNVTANVEQYDSGIKNVKWLKLNNFKYA